MAPKVATLTDPFSGSSLDTSKWTPEGQGTVTVSGGLLTFSATNGPSDDMYNAVNSNVSYDATNSATFVKINPNTTVTQADTGFGYWSSELVNAWTMGVTVGGVTNGVTSAYVQKWVNNDFSFMWSAAYDPTAHAWMQISESGGTLSFQVSSTGQPGSWTTVFATTSESISGGGDNLSLTSVTQECYFGFQDNVKRAGSASFADFNVAPGGGGTAHHGAAALTGTGRLTAGGSRGGGGGASTLYPGAALFPASGLFPGGAGGGPNSSGAAALTGTGRLTAGGSGGTGGGGESSVYPGAALFPASTLFPGGTGGGGGNGSASTLYPDSTLFPRPGLLPGSQGGGTGPGGGGTGFLSWDAQLSRVLIDVASVAGSSAFVTVQRSTDGIRWSDVRGGSNLAVIPGMEPLSDYEFEVGAVNQYRVQTAANNNPGFESGVSDWTGFLGMAVSQSGAWSHSGSFSMLLTGAAGADQPLVITGAGAGSGACQEGDQLSFAPYLYSPQGWATVQIALWVYGSNGRLSFATSNVQLLPGVEMQPDPIRITVPAGGNLVGAVVSMTGTPGPGVQVYVDDAAVYGASALTATASIVPELSTPWLKSVRYPFLNLAVDLSDVSDITRPSRSSTFTVLGRANQVAISLPRGGREMTVTVATTSDDDTAKVHALLASGDVVLLQVPAGYSTPLTGYYSAGDTTETRQGVVWQRRWIQVPLTETDAPSADVIGTQVTWQTVVDSYPTWAALVAGQATWQDVLTIIGAAADVTQ